MPSKCVAPLMYSNRRLKNVAKKEEEQHENMFFGLSFTNSNFTSSTFIRIFFQVLIWNFRFERFAAWLKYVAFTTLIRVLDKIGDTKTLIFDGFTFPVKIINECVTDESFENYNNLLELLLLNIILVLCECCC